MSEQSMRNNLTKAVRTGIKDSGKACHYLKMLHRLTGRSEQFLLSSIVVDAVERLPEYKQFRQELKESWENSNNK